MLVVSDLDGTLLDANHQLCAETKATVKQLVELGYQFMIATGRHYQDVYLIAKQLDVEMSLITSNGARVHNASGEVLFEDHIPEHWVAEILKLSAKFRVHRNLYQQDLWLVEEPHEELLAIHHASGFSYQITDFAAINLAQIDKIYFNASHQELLKLRDKLLEVVGEHLTVTFTSPEYLEIMNKGVSKGHALEMILQQKQLNSEQVLAFGDGMNDCHMLEVAGCGVVMANASEAVKKALPNCYKTQSHAEQGVARFLQTYLLK